MLPVDMDVYGIRFEERDSLTNSTHPASLAESEKPPWSRNVSHEPLSDSSSKSGSPGFLPFSTFSSPLNLRESSAKGRTLFSKMSADSLLKSFMPVKAIYFQLGFLNSSIGNAGNEF